MTKKTDERSFLSYIKVSLFDDTGFAEGVVCTVFLNSAESTSRDIEDKRLFELGNVDALFLEVRVTTNFATGVELSSTSSVGVASSHD